MIELFSCARLSASITQKQCAINRESIISCRGCDGLGELVEVVDGTESQKIAPAGNWASQSISRKGAEGRKVTLRELGAAKDDLVGEYVSVDLVDRPTSVCFDLIDPDDIRLLQKIEAVAYEHGSTLGDEIMVRLHVLEAHL